MEKQRNATLILDNLPMFKGHAALYELSDSVRYCEYNFTNYVICSTIVLDMQFIQESIIETYIFPSDEKGNVLDFGELPGSSKNTESHEFVLNKLGFKLNKKLINFDNALLKLNINK